MVNHRLFTAAAAALLLAIAVVAGPAWADGPDPVVVIGLGAGSHNFEDSTFNGNALATQNFIELYPFSRFAIGLSSQQLWYSQTDTVDDPFLGTYSVTTRLRSNTYFPTATLVLIRSDSGYSRFSAAYGSGTMHATVETDSSFSGPFTLSADFSGAAHKTDIYWDWGDGGYGGRLGVSKLTAYLEPDDPSVISSAPLDVSGTQLFINMRWNIP